MYLIMVHFYKVLTYTRATIVVIAPNSTEKDNILKACKIEGVTIKELACVDNIIISKEYV